MTVMNRNSVGWFKAPSVSALGVTGEGSGLELELGSGLGLVSEGRRVGECPVGVLIEGERYGAG